MAYELITVEADPKLGSDYVLITLDNPAKRNALSAPMMRELLAAFTEVGATDVLGVTQAANGVVFSAGHDFADMAGTDLRAARELLGLCTDMMTAIAEMPQVVIARVHALATAAGCQLVASCDLAVAASSAAFATPGGKGGLFCHTPMVAVARNVGRKRAAELAFTGDPIDAATAAAWGLINRAVPDEELVDATAELLRRATRGSAYSKALGKQTMYAQMELPTDQAYRHAVEMMSAATQTSDAQEGIGSFLQKRRPTWVNR
ncbi:MAG: enoyl-CoA hydratase-related protein [Acidimicrobiales bacterium]